MTRLSPHSRTMVFSDWMRISSLAKSSLFPQTAEWCSVGLSRVPTTAPAMPATMSW